MLPGWKRISGVVIGTPSGLILPRPEGNVERFVSSALARTIRDCDASVEIGAIGA